MEASIGHVDKSLAALLRRFDEVHARTNDEHWEDDNKDEHVTDNLGADYSAGTEVEERGHHRLRHNHQGMGGHHRHEVHHNDNAFIKIKFKMPPFDAKYDLDAYLTWEIVGDQKFACHDLLGLPLLSLLISLLFGG